MTDEVTNIRFRRAVYGGPPLHYNHIKIIDKKSQEPIDEPIIEANADEGWYVHYYDGPPVGGQIVTARVDNVDIEIVATPDCPRGADGGYLDADRRAGVTYDD